MVYDAGRELRYRRPCSIPWMGSPPARGLFLKFYLAVNWFDLLYSFLRQALSFRKIAHTFGLCSSLQVLWLYSGHSGYRFDIFIWFSFRAFLELLLTVAGWPQNVKGCDFRNGSRQRFLWFYRSVLSVFWGFLQPWNLYIKKSVSIKKYLDIIGYKTYLRYSIYPIFPNHRPWKTY